jgi:hypothetical protein
MSRDRAGNQDELISAEQRISENLLASALCSWLSPEADESIDQEIVAMDVRVAPHAHHSTDNPSVTSIEHQFRICPEHAGRGASPPTFSSSAQLGHGFGQTEPLEQRRATRP